MELHVNSTAILVTVVANFFLGFVWYTPLFGKIWAREMGYDPEMKPDGKQMATGMILMVVGNLAFVWVLAHTLAGWQFIPGVSEEGPFRNALWSSLFLWLGFYFPVHLSSMIWERRSWRLFAINGGYHLASLFVASLILSHWS